MPEGILEFITFPQAQFLSMDHIMLWLETAFYFVLLPVSHLHSYVCGR